MNGRAKKFQIFLRMTLLLLIFFNGKVFAQLPTITPEEAGFDSTKLAEVTNQANTVYEAGLIPNYVIALAKDGKIFFSASRGNRVIGENDPVGMDTLFPLASMSKPVVSSAIFKLIEDFCLVSIITCSCVCQSLSNVCVRLIRSPGECHSHIMSISVRDTLIRPGA